MGFHAPRVSHVRRPVREPVATLTAGDGPAVLLVHGWTGFKESWGPLVPALAGAGLRAVAVDLPGCGGSPRRRRGRHDPEGLAAELARAVAAHGAVGVVAHSFGAQVAVLAALRAHVPPPRLALLAPAAAPWPAPRLPPRTVSDLVRVPLAGPSLTRIALALMRRDPARRAAAYRTAVADPAALARDPAMRALLDDAAARLAGADLRVLVEWLRPALDVDLRRLAPSLVAETLVVTGDRDRVVPAGAAGELVAALPHGRLLQVPGVAHFPHLERPERVVPAVVAHLGGRGAP